MWSTRGVARVGGGSGDVVCPDPEFQCWILLDVTVVLVLSAVFIGLWLRPSAYGWWALFVTLAIALMQGFGPALHRKPILRLCLEEMVIGAIIGVAATWFVLPVRSTAVLRRRIADALARLADALDPSTTARRTGCVRGSSRRGRAAGTAVSGPSRLVTRRLAQVQPVRTGSIPWSRAERRRSRSSPATRHRRRCAARSALRAGRCASRGRFNARCWSCMARWRTIAPGRAWLRR